MGTWQASPNLIFIFNLISTSSVSARRFSTAGGVSNKRLPRRLQSASPVQLRALRACMCK